jgi:hypothetical protein
MTAATPPYLGMTNSREAAILTAMADAVTWKHVLEDSLPGPRKGQRVVIYPRELTNLTQVLTTGNPNDGGEEGLTIAYASILQASQSFENPPLFLREDCDQIISNPVWSVEVPKWMATAANVATGSRRRVLENGPDVMKSDEEDALKEEHGEELTGMYAPGCASLDQAKLTEEQTQAQRAAPSSPDLRVPPRSQSPAYDSSDDDTLDSPEHIWSQTKGVYRPNKAWKKLLAQMALALPAPEPVRQSTPMTTPVNSDDEGMSGDQRSMANLGKKMASRGVKTSPPRCPSAPETKAPKPVPEAKALKPTKGQESPETKVSKPMETRAKTKEASRAGGLRGVVGSGPNGDTRVSRGNPASKPGS